MRNGGVLFVVGGRKLFSEKLENSVMKSNYDRRVKGLGFPRKLIIKKAKISRDNV